MQRRQIRTDAVALGAGIAGVSAALHLQMRGRSVVLLDRRAPARKRATGMPDSLSARASFHTAFRVISGQSFFMR